MGFLHQIIASSSFIPTRPNTLAIIIRSSSEVPSLLTFAIILYYAIPTSFFDSVNHRTLVLLYYSARTSQVWDCQIILIEPDGKISVRRNIRTCHSLWLSITPISFLDIHKASLFRDPRNGGMNSWMTAHGRVSPRLNQPLGLSPGSICSYLRRRENSSNHGNLYTGLTLSLSQVSHTLMSLPYWAMSVTLSLKSFVLALRHLRTRPFHYHPWGYNRCNHNSQCNRRLPTNLALNQ